MAAPATLISAATKQQHHENDNQDQFHRNSPPAPAAVSPRTNGLNRPFSPLFPTKPGNLFNQRFGPTSQRSMMKWPSATIPVPVMVLPTNSSIAASLNGLPPARRSARIRPAPSSST